MNKAHSPKEKAIYQAVIELFEEGADLNNLTVAEITGRAGIGKGTAYEYFSDKEEMIAKALFYNGEMFFHQLCEGVEKEKDRYDKVNFVLVTMEQHLTKTNCIFRLIHIMSDNSMISRRIQELEKGKAFRKIFVEGIVRKMLEDDLKKGAMLSEEQMTYLIMSLFSKILCYGMMMNEERYQKGEGRERMRRLVCQGICREVEEILSV